MSQKNNNAIILDTRRDFDALGELIKRSDLGNKDPGVVKLEAIVNQSDDIECDAHWKDDDYNHFSCDSRADIRIVRNRDENFEDGSPRKIYSDNYCLSCFQRELDDWLQRHLAGIAADVFETRERGES